MNIKALHDTGKKGKLQKYDARGIQTLFRTLSRNHYNLLKMVDNKARIILTVNSIITSLLMSVLFLSKDTQHIKLELGARVLLICSMLSMIFALTSARLLKIVATKVFYMQTIFLSFL